MKILIIGASGKIGRFLAQDLKRSGLSFQTSARRSPAADLHIDLRRPETFERLRTFDVIINACPPRRAAPDALVEFALAESLVLIDIHSDPALVQRLLERHRVDRGQSHPGLVILGNELGLLNIFIRSCQPNEGAPPRSLDIILQRGLSWLDFIPMPPFVQHYQAFSKALVPAFAKGPELLLGDRRVSTLPAGDGQLAMVYHAFGIGTVRSFRLPTLPFSHALQRLAQFTPGPLQRSLERLRHRLADPLRAQPWTVHIIFDRLGRRQFLGRRYRADIASGPASQAQLIRLQLEALGERPRPCGVYLPDEILTAEHVSRLVRDKTLFPHTEAFFS